MSERIITFAGALDPGDFTVSEDGQSVTIDREERDLFDAFPDVLREMSAGLPGGAKVLPSACGKYGATSRTPRPYMSSSTGWNPDFAGLGIEDVLRQTATTVAGTSGFLPEHDLEVWSLPVVSVQFDFLLTPAGEWPPEQP